jgi:hypothetical protein
MSQVKACRGETLEGDRTSHMPALGVKTELKLLKTEDVKIGVYLK